MNNGTRVTEFITEAQAMNLADAIQFAYDMDRPLDLAITVHLDKAGVVGRPHEAFIESFLKLAGDWLRLRRIRSYYVWVLERPPGRGLNLHTMIHWPKEHRAELGIRLRGWLKLAGGTNRRNV
jgi:hypothetical protein